MTFECLLPYKKVNPDWYYSYVDIPNLEKIQKEINELVDGDAFRTQANPHYVNIYKQEIYDKCPLLMEYLKNTGLHDKLYRMLVSVKNIYQPNVHVDTNDPNLCLHSLNIPLIEFEDSYTVWYETDKKFLEISETMGNRGRTQELMRSNFGMLSVESCYEVAKVQYNKAALVNTTILHKAMTSTENRRICGLRFSPQLTEKDIKNLGIKYPLKQVE